MATQHRRRFANLLTLFLLVVPVGFWFLIAPSPRTAWLTDNNQHVVGFALNAEVLVTNQGWWHGPIRFWDVDTGKQRFAVGHDWSEINRIDFSPDGRFLAALNKKDEQLIVWDIATGEERLNRKLGKWFDFRFCPDSTHIMFESDGIEPAKPPVGKIKQLYRLPTRFVNFWNLETKCVDVTLPGSISQTAVAKDGQSFALWHWNLKGSAFACVQFWKRDERSGAVALDRQFDMTFCDIALPANLDCFVMVSQQSLSEEGAEIAVWDSATGRKKSAATWRDPKMGVQFMNFSPDDQSVIVDIRGNGRTGWQVVKWDVRSEIKLAPTHPAWKPKLASPDDKLLLLVTEDGADLLETATLAKRGTLHKDGDHLPLGFNGLRHRHPDFAFSADSKMVIATGLVAKSEKRPISDWIAGWFGVRKPERHLLWSGDPVARLYDADTAGELMAFENCSEAQFSPDGRWIATSLDDGTIQIWHAPPRKSLVMVLAFLGIWLAEVIGMCVLRMKRWRTTSPS